jgi:SulP family sulfate permease
MMTPLVIDHGVEYIFGAVILMGIIQMILAAFHLSKYVRMVPYSVLLGFLNGLAIIIFLAQFSQFPAAGNALFIMIGLVAVTMAIIQFLPLLTKAIPSPLVAIIAIALIIQFSPIDSMTVGDTASVAGSFPPFAIPNIPFTLETLSIIFPYSIIFALIGFVHSLMSMSVVDEMTETRGSGNRVVLGQGVANLITGFFGGMGGTTMIGQTIINIKSGGKTHGLR